MLLDDLTRWILAHIGYRVWQRSSDILVSRNLHPEFLGHGANDIGMSCGLIVYVQIEASCLVVGIKDHRRLRSIADSRARMPTALIALC
ncbi:hypothetical protein D3C77_54230 [compost metagenome]